MTRKNNTPITKMANTNTPTEMTRAKVMLPTASFITETGELAPPGGSDAMFDAGGFADWGADELGFDFFANGKLTRKGDQV